MRPPIPHCNAQITSFLPPSEELEGVCNFHATLACIFIIIEVMFMTRRSDQLFHFFTVTHSDKQTLEQRQTRRLTSLRRRALYLARLSKCKPGVCCTSIGRSGDGCTASTPT